MLNVNSDIIDFIKDDGTLKNFRVHFPNGERADLTNSDVIFESVAFSESICSKDTFKFGECNASVISFETVGVGNIIGLVIECSMEYKVPDSLVSTYGEWYAVPYGAFIVDSCPRNHENMVHRKVQAYSPNMAVNGANSIEEMKCQLYWYDDVYTPNLAKVIASMTDDHNVTMIGQSAFSDGSDSGQSLMLLDDFTDEDGHLHELYMMCYVGGSLSNLTTQRKFHYLSANNKLNDSLYRAVMRLNLQNCRTIWEEADDLIEYCNTLDSRYENFRKHSNIYYRTFYNIQNLTFTFNTAASQGSYSQSFGIPLSELKPVQNTLYESPLFYPYFNTSKTSSASATVEIQYLPACTITIEERVDNVVVQGQGFVFSGLSPLVNDEINLVEYETVSTVFSSIRGSYKATGQTDPAYTPVRNSFGGAIKPDDLLPAYAELNAGFIRTERDGSMTLFHLDNSDPYQLVAEDVQDSAWWDEYVIRPVGKILYATSETKQAEYEFNASYTSVYDITGNAILKDLTLPEVTKISSASGLTDTSKLYLFTANTGSYLANHWYQYRDGAWQDCGEYRLDIFAQTLFDQLFIPHLGEIDFTPLEATFRSMPYLQVGDAITLTAADGSVINSYILDQKFSGIQHIEQEMKSVQGEVLGSEVVY